ncbi:MAG: hypothetical protein GWN67_18335, partial [Phycisphaerae bacterium]|nr:hypothetical protein [Phycisphaerae bacterium]NIP54070.1 hypothetical protein [Phycisphaerae bacterium]NIS52998.1 hypothetical protein [Phycisphaerae bacterium]NIU10480.1 hypothetical protein [Phycisphaerae bacterium]NIU58268.1 hypothetical protein [Phycisphaerae bacterium]
MNEQNDKQTEKRISSFLSAVDSGASPPDKQSLNKLQEQSTAEFLAYSDKNVKSDKTSISLWQVVAKSKITKLAAAAVIVIASFAAGHFSTEKIPGRVLKGKSLFAMRLFDEIAQKNDFMIISQDFDSDGEADYMVKFMYVYPDGTAMTGTSTTLRESLLEERLAGERYSEIFRKCQLLKQWEEGTSNEILEIYSANNIA